ncbi:PREDICTED: glutamic acid-rich protein-like [Nicotiana attenuata]|uniref:glutamic acid-rich protein-like n=1 Tax=Nicotiana attenuata TaxID=49451 RepID=UPI000904BC66|nr:PREDICTED: glutamic acid-rich protein-like [Nicotiana attenuata]
MSTKNDKLISNSSCVKLNIKERESDKASLEKQVKDLKNQVLELTFENEKSSHIHGKRKMSDLQDKVEKELKIANDDLCDVERRNKVLHENLENANELSRLSKWRRSSDALNWLSENCTSIKFGIGYRKPIPKFDLKNTFGIAKNMKKEEEPKVNPPVHTKWIKETGTCQTLSTQQVDTKGLDPWLPKVEFTSDKDEDYDIGFIGDGDTKESNEDGSENHKEIDNDHEEQEEERTTLTTDPTNEATPTEPAPFGHFSGFHVDRKSTSGTAHFLGSCLVSWKPRSKTQWPYLQLRLNMWQQHPALTKIKATPRKSIQKVPDPSTQGDTVAKESVLQGESMLVTIDQKRCRGLEKEVDTTTMEHVVEGEGSKEPVQKKASDGLSITNEEEKSENEGTSGGEKESDTEDKTGEQANDFVEEENHSEEEEVFESKDKDQEKVSESEGGAEDSEEEEGNVSEESEGSMTIGKNVITPSEETGEETRAQEPGSLLTPFTGDEEVSSDKDDVPLSEVGKKSRKTHVKATKSVVSTRK